MFNGHILLLTYTIQRDKNHKNCLNFDLYTNVNRAEEEL